MVNIMVNVSAYAGMPPGEGEPLEIQGGPIYEPGAILAILGKGSPSAHAWTRKCIQDVQQLGFDDADLCTLLADAINKGRYSKSMWCVQKPTGPWAACDAYLLERREWNNYAHKELSIEYYVKFAIAKSGQVLLIISCHLQR